jgi:hypothetical protein
VTAFLGGLIARDGLDQLKVSNKANRTSIAAKDERSKNIKYFV